MPTVGWSRPSVTRCPAAATSAGPLAGPFHGAYNPAKNGKWVAKLSEQIVYENRGWAPARFPDGSGQRPGRPGRRTCRTSS